MKVVYTAGPYRAKTVHGILENIRRAEQVAIQVWRLGHVAFCPHMNSSFFDGLVPDETFLSGTMEMLKRCDCVVLVPGWESSIGTAKEMEYCVDHGKEVYLDFWHLANNDPLTSQFIREHCSIINHQLKCQNMPHSLEPNLTQDEIDLLLAKI